MQEVFEKTTSGLEHEKIKTNYAEIIIKHPLEKPYYAIIYFDLTDGELHEGFGSYCLEYVVEWKRDYFEIVDQVAKEFADDTNVGHKNGWIPIEESLPDTDRLVLISFANYGVPQIGRYREDEEGGAFYLGDEDVPMSKYGIMVNAWMELPRCYEDK